MDSLMSVEFLHRVNHGLRLNLPMQVLLENAAIDALAERIVRELSPADGGRQAGEAAPPGPRAPRPEGAPAGAENPWFPDHRAESGARVRLFCFHAPGGEAAVYAGWSDVLRPDVEVLAVQSPGSGTRASEPPIERWPSLVETLAEQLLDYLDRPFAFFGHSSGSLVALDVAHLVQGRFGLSPVRLFVLGSRSPGAEDRAGAERSGFRVVRHAPGPPLDCPITAFAAREDEQCGPEELQAWSECTVGGFRVEVAPGSSAGLLADPARLLETVAGELRRAVEG